MNEWVDIGILKLNAAAAAAGADCVYVSIMISKVYLSIFSIKRIY